MEDIQTAYRSHLSRLSGSSPIPLDDAFWLQLTRISGVSLARTEPSLLFTFLEPFALQLAKTNNSTGHFGILITHCIEFVASASSFSSQASAQDVEAATNCIILLRSLTVALLRAIPPSGRRSALFAPSGQDVSQDGLLQLVSVCLAYIEQAELSAHTYTLYHASVAFLTACCCSSLYHAEDSTAGIDLVLHILHNRQQNYPAIVSKLLDTIVQQLPVSSTVLYQPPPKAEDGAASMLGTVNRMMMMPARAVSSLWRQESWSGARSPAADASMSLLLLLLHQEHPTSHLEEPGFHASFQGGTVQGLANNDGTSLDGATSGSAVRRSSAGSTSFAALFEWLVDHSQEQQTALLIYTLLMRCTSFRQTLLVRSDIDRLIVPLLEQLYMDTTEHVNHLYVLQIVLLLFSQDDGLARTVYKVRLQKVQWYSDRAALDISLGDLMLIVLLKSGFRNVTAVRDEYVHTNFMSTLINLAPQAVKLGPVATQRLCSCIEASRKRLSWLDQKIVESEQKDGIIQERKLLEDFLKNLIILLDILVYRTLPKNPELVYSMLHQQSVLLRLAGEPECGKHLKNTQKVVQHFNACVDAARQSLTGSGSHGDEWSVAQVMAVIQHELLSWKKSDLHHVEDMQCTYEEAPRACDFFLPYVWSTITASPAGAECWEQSTAAAVHATPPVHIRALCGKHVLRGEDEIHRTFLELPH